MLRRLVFAGLVAAALVGCTGPDPEREPFAESQVPPSLAAPYLPPEGWAWGYLHLGDGPIRRDGVSSPPVAPDAQVIILPGYGESAEAWFETARDLNRRRYNVWVLEAAGQGGSGRLASPRDLGHAANMTPDAEAVRDLTQLVIRPARGEPVVLVASGTAAPLGLAAAQLPRFGFAAVILSDPQRLALTNVAAPPWAPFWPSRAAGQGEWHRPELADLSPRRAAAARWAIANPDLRMGGYSWGYVRAWRSLADSATAPERLREVRGRVTVLARRPDAFAAVCRSIQLDAAGNIING